MTDEAASRAKLMGLATLITEKNLLERQIAGIVGRPGERGHVGEFIASLIFDIRLHGSAATKASDGFFQGGPLTGKSVNIKWYGQQQGVLDVSPDLGPDFYLVLTGPRAPAASSRLAVRPWVIDHVYLFEQRTLVAALRERGVHIGVATSMQNALWEAAEIYPMARNPLLTLSGNQTSLLAAFASRGMIELTRGSGVGEGGRDEDRMGGVCEEVRELFRTLPAAGKRRSAHTPSLAHVLPGLLAKAHSDFTALCDLTWSGRTSGCAALGRMFLEDTVDLYYLTSGEAAEPERRAAEFLCLALVDQERQELVEELMKAAHSRGELYQLGAFQGVNKKALGQVREQLRGMPTGMWRDKLLSTVEGWGDAVPRYPNMPVRLASIEKITTLPMVLSNLIGAYQRFYPGFSDFVHGGGALKHIAEIGSSEDGATRVGLSTGRLAEGHETPLITALLFAPDFLARYNDYFDCGAGNRIRALAERRWVLLEEGLEA